MISQGVDIMGDATRTLHRFTVNDYYHMTDVGILERGDRVELLDGQVVTMSPSGSKHAACIRFLMQEFAQKMGDRGLLSVQLPLRLDQWNEPEPDLALLHPREDGYARAHPGPKDAHLVIEVGDSSARHDREIKLPLYAQFGIPELWLVDRQQMRVEVHREPRNGSYAAVNVLKPPAEAHPEAFPDICIDVSRLFLD